MPIKRVQRGRNHSYTINGVKAIGVTTALSKGLPKPALPYWAARTVAEHAVAIAEQLPNTIRTLGERGAINALKDKPWAERDQAAARGTDVHAMAELLVRGEEVAVPDHLAGHVESAARFMDDWKVQPVVTERVVGSYTWNYAGTFDLIADVRGDQRVLFDYKTSKSGIFAETAFQLAAYQHADMYVADDGTELPLSELRIDSCKAVWVRADGYDVVPLITDTSVFNAFLHILCVARVSEVMQQFVLPTEYAS